MTLEVDAVTSRLFGASLDRCTANPTFFQRFYARFLLTDPEIAAHFEGIDLDRQARVLRASLYLVLRAARGFEDGLTHLTDIARSHAHGGHNIKPDHYEHWLHTLLLVVAELDPEHDAEVAHAWETALRACIDAMVAEWRASQAK